MRPALLARPIAGHAGLVCPCQSISLLRRLAPSPASRKATTALRAAAAAAADSSGPSPSTSASAAAAANPFHWTTIAVRDSELDQYAVVNNAVYSVYLEHSRHCWLADAGLESAADAAAGGGALALSEISVRFAAPLRSGDVCRVGVRLAKATPARLVCEQRVELVERRAGRGGDGGSATTTASAADAAVVVVEATATVVSLDAAYKPRRIPAGVREALAGWSGENKGGKGGGGTVSWDGA